jgi:hypothetical protein
MKKYFKVKIPNNYEWVQMKRIAIKLLIQQGKTISEICEIVDLTKSNVFRNRKLPIDKEIEFKFVEMVHCELYPIKHKTKIKWIKI